MIREDDDGGPVVGEGTAEGVSEGGLRREADERREDGRVDGEESRGLVLGGRGEGTGEGRTLEAGAGAGAVRGWHCRGRAESGGGGGG